MSGPINIEQLKKIHERFKKRHEAVVKEAMRTGGYGAVQYVKNRSTFKRGRGLAAGQFGPARPGRGTSLKDNTKYRIVKARGGKILKLYWTKKYAPYVEDGTRPHPISIHEIGGGSGSTRGKALRFRGRGGQWIFRRSVMHPGTKPYRYGIRAAKHAHMIIGKRLREGMQRAAIRF